MYSQKREIDISKLLDFPLQTRQDVQREQSCFLNSQYQRYPDIERVLVKRSLGLQGIPLEIYWDSWDDKHSQAALWEFRKRYFGITANDKYCIFRTAEYAGNKIMDYMPERLSQDKKTLSFSIRNLSPDWLKRCLENISAFNPIWMRLSPSIAVMLAESMALNGQNFPSCLRYLEFSGEMLNEQMESLIRNTFHVQIANIYSTKDAGPVAVSCTYGDMHIFSENVIVEVIKDGKLVKDEEGDIYLTSLQNNAMSLIRIKTGDRGILQSATCQCGQNSPVLRLTKGRDCEFVLTASGRKISALVLRSLVEYANEEVSHCLSHIHFRQTGYDSMEVALCVKPAFHGWEEEFARVFCAQIEDPELKQMRWEFRTVNLYDNENVEMDERLFFEMYGGMNNGK